MSQTKYKIKTDDPDSLIPWNKLTQSQKNQFILLQYPYINKFRKRRSPINLNHIKSQNFNQLNDNIINGHNDVTNNYQINTHDENDPLLTKNKSESPMLIPKYGQTKQRNIKTMTSKIKSSIINRKNNQVKLKGSIVNKNYTNGNHINNDIPSNNESKCNSNINGNNVDNDSVMDSVDFESGSEINDVDMQDYGAKKKTKSNSIELSEDIRNWNAKDKTIDELKTNLEKHIGISLNIDEFINDPEFNIDIPFCDDIETQNINDDTRNQAIKCLYDISPLEYIDPDITLLRLEHDKTNLFLGQDIGKIKLPNGPPCLYVPEKVYKPANIWNLYYDGDTPSKVPMVTPLPTHIKNQNISQLNELKSKFKLNLIDLPKMINPSKLKSQILNDNALKQKKVNKLKKDVYYNKLVSNTPPKKSKQERKKRTKKRHKNSKITEGTLNPADYTREQLRNAIYNNNGELVYVPAVDIHNKRLKKYNYEVKDSGICQLCSKDNIKCVGIEKLHIPGKIWMCEECNLMFRIPIRRNLRTKKWRIMDSNLGSNNNVKNMFSKSCSIESVTTSNNNDEEGSPFVIDDDSNIITHNNDDDVDVDNPDEPNDNN